ncbi:hypothetical protein [Streptomyces sp. NPDC054804]
MRPIGALVAERVGAEQEMPYRSGAFGQGIGDQGGARRADALLAQVETAVRQHGAGREVQPLPGRASGPQPVQQRGEFGGRARHDVRHPGERRLLAHHAASR